MEIERDIVLPVTREEAWDALTDPGAAGGVVRERRRARPVPGGRSGVPRGRRGGAPRRRRDVRGARAARPRWEDDGRGGTESLGRAPGRHACPRAGDAPTNGAIAPRAAGERRVGARRRSRLRRPRRPEPSLPRRAPRAPRRGPLRRSSRASSRDAAGGRRSTSRRWSRPGLVHVHPRGPQTRYRPDPPPAGRDGVDHPCRNQWDERLAALARHVGRER